MDSGLSHPSGAGSGQIDTSTAPSSFHPALLLRSSGRDLGNGMLHPSINFLFVSPVERTNMAVPVEDCVPRDFLRSGGDS